MDPFRKVLGSVCKRPEMWVGSKDFHMVSTFLLGYSTAMKDLRPDLGDAGLSGFGKWLAVRLDSCVRSLWPEIILREDTGPDKFEALVRFYDEFAQDRSVRGMNAIHADFERLIHASFRGGGRTCWCELPPNERDQWRPGGKPTATTQTPDHEVGDL